MALFYVQLNKYSCQFFNYLASFVQNSVIINLIKNAISFLKIIDIITDNVTAIIMAKINFIS